MLGGNFLAKWDEYALLVYSLQNHSRNGFYKLFLPIFEFRTVFTWAFSKRLLHNSNSYSVAQ